MSIFNGRSNEVSASPRSMSQRPASVHISCTAGGRLLFGQQVANFRQELLVLGQEWWRSGFLFLVTHDPAEEFDHKQKQDQRRDQERDHVRQEFAIGNGFSFDVPNQSLIALGV